MTKHFVCDRCRGKQQNCQHYPVPMPQLSLEQLHDGFASSHALRDDKGIIGEVYIQNGSARWANLFRVAPLLLDAVRGFVRDRATCPTTNVWATQVEVILCVSTCLVTKSKAASPISLATGY